MELTGIETFRYTNPFPEEIPAEGTYKVYNNVSNLDIKTLLTNKARPVFVFPKRVWDEVQYITKQSPKSEFALFLITKQFTQLAPKYMALDIYFPKQEADSGGVSIDNEDVLGFYELLSTHEDYKDHMHAKIAHLHSHNSMGVFWSAADTNQQLGTDDLGYFDDFRYYLVVNIHDQVRCSFVVYKPLLRRVDDIPVVVIGTEDTLTDERKAELDAYLEERVTHKLTTNVFADIKTFDGYETELPSSASGNTSKFKDSVCTLADVVIGQNVLFNNKEYLYVGRKGKLAQLEGQDGHRIHVVLTAEVTCC